jgi:hypothetical protein
MLSAPDWDAPPSRRGRGTPRRSQHRVRAQQFDRVRRIKLLGGDENDPVRETYVSAFTQALADLGWAAGRNVRMDLRWFGDDINRVQA